MKVPILLLFWALSARAEPYGPPEISSWLIKPGQRGISVRVTPSRGAVVPTGPVLFTLEPYTLALPPGQNSLDERNLLGSGLALDLDGDGKRRGRWPLDCATGALRIGPWSALPMGLATVIYPETPLRLGERGAGLQVYGACGSALLLGLAPAELPQLSLPGPVLQISIIEPMGLKGMPKLRPSTFTLDTRPVAPRQAEVRSWEVLSSAKDARPEWAHVQLILLPISPKGTQTLDFRIEGVGPGLISATVSTALVPGQRRRGPGAGRVLP